MNSRTILECSSFKINKVIKFVPVPVIFILIDNYCEIDYFSLIELWIANFILWISLISFHVDAMIGDTNLYLVEEDDCLTAETGVMIAERALRGGGRGKEAMLLMLRYGKYLNLSF